MAGLNVLVFADNDGSRAFNSAVDAPAANRLVYVDLNRSGVFEDGEPLAVSGADGYAKFANLSAGEYAVGLAGLNSAQIQTTSVVSDALASLVVSAETQTLIGSDDLNHVWSVSPTGRVIFADTTSAGAPRSLSLGGPVVSATSVRTNTAGESIAWALVDRGETEPTLVRLDLTNANANARDVAIEVPASHSLVGVALMADQLVLKLDTASESFVSVADLGDDGATIVNRIAAPRGQLVGSSLAGRLAIIGSDPTAGLATLRITDAVALIETAATDRILTGVQYSADGQFLFAAHAGGGLEVFSTHQGFASVAFLAEAAGPIAVSRNDGRVITGNASQSGELIVWDSHTWRPTGRITLAGQTGALQGLAVDAFGERVFAATSSAIYRAGLANSGLMSVTVAAGNHPTDTRLGVRLVTRPFDLPHSVQASESLDEDGTLTIDLAGIPALAALGAAKLMFAPSVHPRTGTMIVTPSGRLTYRPAANANGHDRAELKVYDGVSTTSLVLSLDVASVNDLPSSFVIDTHPIEEFAPSETSAGFTTVFDVDTDARYVIMSSDPRFYVMNGQLLRSNVGDLDYEQEPVVILQLTAVDVTNPDHALTQSVSIPVVNANDGPTSFELAYAPVVSENNAGGSIVDLTINDPDGYGEYVYTVSDERFEVVAGQLRLKDGVSLDYETESHIELTLAVSDPTAMTSGHSVSQVISIDVEDENDAPSGISIDTAELHPNEPGAYVGLILIEDQDALDEYTYVVSDPRFVVEGNALRLKEGEQVTTATGEKNIPVLVTARDADGNIISQSISVQVVNDAPFQNPRNPLDVDNDGEVYPRDVLILIDMLNRKGPHIIEPLTGAGEGGDGEQDIFIDVNGDGIFSPLDALILINHLNKRGSLPGEGEAAPAVDDKDEVLPRANPSSLAVAPDAVTEDVSNQLSQPLESTTEAASVDLALVVPKEDDRDELDSELELLLEQLSRERLR